MSFVFPAETDGRLRQRLRVSRLLDAASQKFQQTSGLENPFVRLDAEQPADAPREKAEEAGGRRPYITSVCGLFLVRRLTAAAGWEAS